jgi:hypothetical protein
MTPIAWYDPTNGAVSADKDSPLFTPLGQVLPLYPEGEWVGLTDSELMECTVFKRFDYDPPYIDKDGAKHVGSMEVSLRATYENINSKLKEKNA